MNHVLIDVRQRSAYEESLIGTPVANQEQPLEIIRTIHSFDPCLACAVHLYDPDGIFRDNLARALDERTEWTCVHWRSLVDADE